MAVKNLPENYPVIFAVKVGDGGGGMRNLELTCKF